MFKKKLKYLITSMALVLAVSAAASASPPPTFDDKLRHHLATLPEIQGTPLTMSALQDRAVLVTFFASWCPPCREEFKYLNTLRTEYSPEQLTIIGVNVFEAYFESGDERLNRFLAATNPQFHLVKGDETTKALFDNVERIPTLFVFTPRGKTVEHFIHKRGAAKQTASLAELRDAIEQALLD